ncbi:MAG: metallophosphoesterase [Candidatus Moduliflexus flocculans]|nr:metallophosphoesterase [Candidatus Moduliflexus flocculans]
MTRSRRGRPGLRLILIAILAVLGLASCAVRPPAPVPPAESHIVIFHINDTHAKIDAFAKVAAILDAERKAGSEVFFFSAGDIFTGDPVVDRYDPPGRPIVEILERLGLDLLTLGNHEFDYGQDALKDLLARFRTVSANIEAQAGVLPGLEPAAVLKTRDGLRLVVFGLIQVEPGNGLPSSHPDKLQGTAVQRAAGSGRRAEAAARRRRDPDRPDAHRLPAGPRPGPAVAADRRDRRRTFPHQGRSRGERRQACWWLRPEATTASSDGSTSACDGGRIVEKGRPDRSRPDDRRRRRDQGAHRRSSGRTRPSPGSSPRPRSRSAARTPWAA